MKTIVESMTNISIEEVKKISGKLDKLVDAATALYTSDAEIPKDLAIELGYLWEMCRDYVQMYENCSRDYPEEEENAPQPF